ncbi:hypothetical protein cyc_06793 [Cyclospora cayetanensis]|uniref:Uncharacterized protein n=1 Tax=Cyclospora cayetanensis TaxID=88456 RepID=A0A1D3CU84_9EIME|nr:hypothetical protein cyc_06793 [Cyclospora cayetanensis]
MADSKLESPRDGIPESSWWGTGPRFCPPCHPNLSEEKTIPGSLSVKPCHPFEIPSIGFERLLPGTGSRAEAQPTVATATPAAAAAASPCASTTSDSEGCLVTLVSPTLPSHWGISSAPGAPATTEAPQKLHSGNIVCLHCGNPQEGRSVCVSYQAWWLELPTPDEGQEPKDAWQPLCEGKCLPREGLWSSAQLQQHFNEPPSAAAYLVVASVGTALFGPGLNAALQRMLPGEEALLLLRATAAPPTLLLQRQAEPSTPSNEAATLTKGEQPCCLLMRIRLHYQTTMLPLSPPLPLFRSLYRRLLHSPAPKRPKQGASEAAAAFSEEEKPQRCCCCSSEEAYSGADDPDTDSDACSCSATSYSGSNNHSDHVCAVCKSRQQTRASRSSRVVLQQPCGFYCRNSTGSTAGPSGEPPLDFWHVTLQFSLYLQSPLQSQGPLPPLGAPQDGSAVTSSQFEDLRNTRLRLAPPQGTVHDAQKAPVCTYSYTLGEGPPLCPAVDVWIRGPFYADSSVDMWVEPLWGSGCLDEGSTSKVSCGCGPQARNALPGVACPALLGKPLYFKDLKIVSLSPPRSASSSSLLSAHVLRKEANTKFVKGHIHAALRLYRRAEAVLEAAPREGPTSQWALSTLQLNEALALLRLRRFEEALDCADKACPCGAVELYWCCGEH